MSIESNLAAGQIAMRVMDREIFNWLDWMVPQFSTTTALKILDRWALNSPEKLKELEKPWNRGKLFNRFAGQVEQELEAKETERYWDLIDSGLSHWEALEAMGINVNL